MVDTYEAWSALNPNWTPEAFLPWFCQLNMSSIYEIECLSLKQIEQHAQSE